MSFLASEKLPEVSQVPTDEEIIYDWRRHDAFRFRSVLFPILLILLSTSGQWSASPWIPQLQQQEAYFEEWGVLDELVQGVWMTRILFLGLAPLATVFLCNPLPSRSKMRAVIALTLVSSLVQALAFLNTSKGMFFFSVGVSSFAFGLSFHTLVMTLLNWFPDFSVFVFAGVLLVSMLSHWINLSIGQGVASRFALPSLPIFQGIMFMFTVIPLHFFIQPPPTYIALFIRSMLSAAEKALPQSKTLPLPTTLGIAARIPRALGKLQQWKKKLKHRGASRRGYGELVNDYDVDEFEQVEMQVAQGFDNDLDDLYNNTPYTGNDPTVMNKPTKKSKSKLNKSQKVKLESDMHQVAIDIATADVTNDPLVAAARGITFGNTTNNNNNQTAATTSTTTAPVKSCCGQKTSNNNSNNTSGNNMKYNNLSRPSDDEDNGDPDFAFEDSNNDIGNNNNDTFEPYHNNNSRNNNNLQPDTVHDNEFDAHPIHSQTSSAPSPRNNTMSFGNTARAPIQHTNFNATVGLALSTVVSQLDHYKPLTIPMLCNHRPFQMYTLSLILPLLFPFLLLNLTPTIYIHLQNRTTEAAQSVFDSTITVSAIIAVLLLVAAQFLGNKGILTFSAVLILVGSLFWGTAAASGNQYNTDIADSTIVRSLSNIHMVIGIIYIGTTIYSFLAFTTIQKYFHDENVRITSGLTIAILCFTYFLSTVVLLPFRDALKENTYSPETFVAINALAYDWVSRIGFILTIIALVCLYRLRPLSVGERWIYSHSSISGDGAGVIQRDDGDSDVVDLDGIDEGQIKNSPYHNESTIMQSVHNANAVKPPQAHTYE